MPISAPQSTKGGATIRPLPNSYLSTEAGQLHYSHSGLLRCAHCGERMRVVYTHKGRVRYYCRSKAQGVGCVGKGSFLDLYEEQIVADLANFVLPDDWQRQVVGGSAMGSAGADVEQQRRQLQSRLHRLKDLYGWGDLSREEYQVERDTIERALARLAPIEQRDDHLVRLEAYVRSLPAAWQDADAEQRNRLASAIYEGVWVDGARVEYVKPRPELEPLFQVRAGAAQPTRWAMRELSTMGQNVGSGDPDGGPDPTCHKCHIATERLDQRWWLSQSPVSSIRLEGERGRPMLLWSSIRSFPPVCRRVNHFACLHASTTGHTKPSDESRNHWQAWSCRTNLPSWQTARADRRSQFTSCEREPDATGRPLARG